MQQPKETSEQKTMTTLEDVSMNTTAETSKIPQKEVLSTSSSVDKQPQVNDTDFKMYRKGVLFFIMLGVAFLLSMVIYASTHGINYFRLLFDSTLKFTVDFVGGERNAYSVGIEATVWAFWGVTCRISYLTLKALQAKTFRFFEYTAIWFGTIAFAWGVSVALILSLSVMSLTIGTAQITLENASIETIMAIAFIIGFFNEQALKLLEQVRDRLTGGEEEKPSHEQTLQLLEQIRERLTGEMKGKKSSKEE